MSVRHDACKFCQLDIEGFSPYPVGEWMDRGGNRKCSGKNRYHLPAVVPTELSDLQDIFDACVATQRLHWDAVRTLEKALGFEINGVDDWAAITLGDVFEARIGNSDV